MAKRKVAVSVDEENPEWTKEDFASAKKFEDLPASLQAKLSRSRGPQKAPTKELISIRLSKDVLGQFRESGPGWQGKIDEALREWLKRHPVQ